MSPCTLLTLREELCTPGYPERREVTGEVTGPASRSGPLSLSFCLSDVYLPNLRFCVLSVAQGLALWLLYIILLNLPLNSSSFTIDSCYLPCTNRTGGKLYPTWELLSCRRLKTILRPKPGSLGYMVAEEFCQDRAIIVEQLTHRHCLSLHLYLCYQSYPGIGLRIMAQEQ